ncbi:galactose-3-O-sulfotransferase 2 [Pimephales promelas]|uniref:galactose-3-O-sulfotransferase 2 n=1 Tax=Pimephales promelas TaxID=90988 RepID=UPI001955BD19|nr:galactose-3-O-sulfotransferase 2 [Pimephales promelas]KAG1952030.1 galactosylceramide sulfotransferase [Pimephales promelas]
MLPPRRITGRERRAFNWRTTSPWTTCVRVACCSRLRFMWFTLMVLTVLCMALQMLGVVRQPRSSKVLKLVSEQLVKMPTDIHRPVKRIDWENLGNLWSVSATTVEEPVDQHYFIQKIGESLNLHLEEERDQVLKVTRTKLTSITKDVPPIEPNKLLLDQEVDKRFQHQPIIDENDPEIQKPPHSDNDTDQYTLKSEAATCQPKKRIVFLKTHKTASSTILNILYRYGDSHNLTFALPLNMHSQLFYPAFFAAHFVEGVRTRSVKEFHILCNHMRFSSQEVRKLMPKDTFYFSILRNPVAMMESLFVYYKAIPAFRVVKSLEEFLNQGGRSYNTSVPNNHYARNILTFDFGLDNTAPVNDTDLDRRSAEVITAVERDFPLILISEYFDESLVLLKHALCWSLDDISSFRLNSRSERSRRPLNAETAERVKQWNSLDWRLYQHFNATFWKRIDSTLGRTQLRREVELLRAKRTKLEQMCLQEGGAVDPVQVKDSSLKPFQYGAAVIQGYNLRLGLNNDTFGLCQRLITPELQYTSALYTKQFPQLAAARAAVAKKIAASRNIATHRAVKRNIETYVRIAVTNNTSHNNTNTAIGDEHGLDVLRNSVVRSERQGSFEVHSVTKRHRKGDSDKRTTQKPVMNSNIHKEPH